MISDALSRGTTAIPSASPTMMSPGDTTVPPQLIGTLISPGPSLSQLPGHTVRLYAGNAEPTDPLDIAHRAVDDDAAELRRGRRVAHELAEHRARRIAAGADDDNLAGLRDLQRLVHHEIVGGPALHGDRESAEREAAARLHAGIHEAEAAHRVGDVGTGEAAEAVEKIVAEARRGGKHPETGVPGHRGFLLSELRSFNSGESYASTVAVDTGS